MGFRLEPTGTATVSNGDETLTGAYEVREAAPAPAITNLTRIYFSASPETILVVEVPTPMIETGGARYRGADTYTIVVVGAADGGRLPTLLGFNAAWCTAS